MADVDGAYIGRVDGGAIYDSPHPLTFESTGAILPLLVGEAFSAPPETFVPFVWGGSLFLNVGGASSGVGGPTFANLTPNTLAPGQAGAFDSSYPTAKLTPIAFDLYGFPGEAVITVKFSNRAETYVARGADENGNMVWLWPFDTAGSTIGAQGTEPRHVTLLPRGGWPLATVSIQAFSATRAVDS